jgi:hydroxypyruvate reductase
MPTRHRALLEALHAAAVDGVRPERAVTAALDAADVPADPVVLLALGKAAAPMCAAAVAWLAARGARPRAGLVVSPAPSAVPDPAIEVVPGDHPVPGDGSACAAAALARVIDAHAHGAEAWVLLSGGASALVGAPVEGVADADYRALFRMLLGAGVDIATMNALRKRVGRWGAGRLAEALAGLGARRIRVLAISDVPDDDPATIGSGPCAPDDPSASELRRRAESAGLWRSLPAGVRRYVELVEEGAAAETPKRGDAAFARVETAIVASNRQAVAGAAARAEAAGLDVVVAPEPLAGEAARAGERIAETLLQAERAGRHRCLIWGGETTVTLGAGSGRGGRCQELALAAAQVLARGPSRAALLAAGTDGRDGPTDAAGAVVDSATWVAILGAGRDPAVALASHDAYGALDAAGALLRTGLTGTNVADVVIGIV